MGFGSRQNPRPSPRAPDTSESPGSPPSQAGCFPPRHRTARSRCGVAATLPLVQDLLDRLEAGFEPQELASSGSQNGEASADNRAMVIGAMSDAATGPIPAGGLAKGRPQIGEDPSKQFIMIVLQPLTRRDCQSQESRVCPTYTTTHPS
jgi:hypothetical protein